MVFYDVGANGGFLSLLGASLVGPSGKVVAFEPHPITAHQLSEQMRVNGFRNVDVVVAALSDKSGFAEFSDEGSSTMLSLVGAGHVSRTIRVTTTTLDREIKTRPVPDLLKIDVEGSEIEVLGGGRNLFATKRPTLLVEIHSDELAVRYDNLMTDFGYVTQDLAGKQISVAESGERFVVSTPE
jgi:FkbM family methyltransferase